MWDYIKFKIFSVLCQHCDNIRCSSFLKQLIINPSRNNGALVKSVGHSICHMPRIEEETHPLEHSKIDRTIMEKAVECVNLAYFLSAQWGGGGVDIYNMLSLLAQTIKNLPAIWETWVQYLGWEDPLEEGMATHSSILAWRIQ